MESRTKNTKRNIISGIALKLITMALPFVVRTTLLYVMGEYYTGLSSLFTSILQVLNLAELGFSSAIVYNMYKPLADNDTSKVCALLNFYRKIYTLIGIVILVAGCAIMPWLPKLINGTYPDDINLYFLYLLYLLNTVLSYWLFAYKSSLIHAVQRMDLQNKVYVVTLVLANIAQILIIITTHNFYLYVVVSIVKTIVDNLAINYISKKHFPQYACEGTLEVETRSQIKTQVAGIMVEKIGDTCRNSFDSIVLSTFLGLTAVTIYSNYYYIFSSVYGVLLIITQGMAASVGNSVSTESVEKNYHDLCKFQFMFCGIICFCVTCLVCLYQTFMEMWVGQRLMLPFFEMSLFCIYFFILNSSNAVQMYYSTNGLWWKAKTYTLAEAIGNLVLNILLGRILGTKGVLLATIITISILQFIPRTWITFKNYFAMSPLSYYKSTALYGGATLVSCIVAHQICIRIPFSGFANLCVGLVVSAIVSLSVYLIAFARTKEEKEALRYVRTIVK